MWSLPDCVTVWVFAHLPTSDLAGVAVVCRYFHTTVRSKELIALLFERDLFLFTSYSGPFGTFSVSYATQCQLLKNVKRMNVDTLDYYGFATNGGVDEDNTHFWLRRVFQKTRSAGYCSQENARNVNIAGVLKGSQELQAEKDALEVIKRRLQTVLSRVERGGRQLSELVGNEDLLLLYGADTLKHLATNVPELVLFDGEQPADMQKSVRELIKNTKSEAPKLQELLKDPYNSLILAEPVPLPTFPACIRLSFLKSIRISRKGGFTCPVQTLVIFTSLNYISVESAAFDVYNNLWTLGDVRALVESTSSVPPVYHTETTEAYTLCEFRGKAGCHLQPVLWLTFDPREETRKRAVTVQLQQVFPSLYLYAKLIKPEDRRVERGWEHELMNIDVKYILPKGQVLELT